MHYTALFRHSHNATTTTFSRGGALTGPWLAGILHLGLEVFEQGLELVHVGLLLGPADAETFRLVGLGDLGGGISI